VIMVVVFVVSIVMPNPRTHGYLQGHGSVD
jgi:MHS family alpha-ketoglutarate permease-like MFS transporter